MSFKGSTLVPRAFVEGKVKKSGANQSTGASLYYHGNKIAEWRDGGLWVSNGGYTTTTRNGNEVTGSKTTKDKLNALPNVRLYQSNCKWYLNGVEWDGSWIKIKGVKAPTIDTSKLGEVFDTSKKYIKSDGWRGYEQPEFAVAGANDTGMYSDSPCPTVVCEKELKDIETLLEKEGIKTKQVVCETSNVFCVHRYLIPMLKHVERARVIVEDYLNNNETRLAYVVK